MEYNRDFDLIESNEVIFDKIRDEINNVGYYHLPFADVSTVVNFARRVAFKYVVVLGIGGSSLGCEAVYEFLKRKEQFGRKLLFLNSTDPVDISSKIESVNLNDTFFLIISKSGTTVETISILKYVSTLVNLGSDNSAVISGLATPLEHFAHERKIPFFDLADNIGGRFSVFSIVGLLPLAIVGVDIANMLEGAKKVFHSFFAKGRYYKILMNKARFIVENKNKFNINVLLSYSSGLEGFNKWYIQLWAESLGKVTVDGTRQGLTPIGLLGPVDQHSFLQLIIEGTRDKTVTFITVTDSEGQIIIPKNTPIDELDYLEGISFSCLIDLQARATIEAIRNEKDIPLDIITIDKVDGYNIAELMYSYELLVSIIGKFLQIDAYDQPGVESGKVILKRLLSGNSL